MSRILDIYQAIADTPIAFTSAMGPLAIYGVSLDETPNTVDSAAMPVRLLQPFGGRGDARLETHWSPGAGVITVDWGIADMCFYRAAAAGVGLADVAAELIRYKVAYMAAISALRTPKWGVTGIVLTVDAFEWPAQSGRIYDGVIARLTVREIIP